MGTEATDNPISPELVLVSPDLAAGARAALPDRPWEFFATVAGRPAAPTVQMTPPVAHRARLRRLPLGLVMLLILVASLVYSGFPPLRDAPTLGGEARAAAVSALPDTYYLYGRSGRMLTGPDGRSIAVVEIPFGCLGLVRFERIPIGRGGEFSAIDTENGRVVALAGRVERAETIRAAVLARSSGCPVVSLSFVAAPS